VPDGAPATPRVAAGALFGDDRGRILLVHPTYKDSWEIPGGYVERGESPAAACRREVHEELGLDRPPLGLITVDWAPNDRDGDKLLFLFDCGALGPTGAIRLPPDELDGWEWVELQRLDGYVVDRLARRLRAALAPSPSGYLEHGRPVPPHGA
jgi:8-oxo-dGTP pyrophosphatase MutT (NUDIX family)